MNHRVCPVSYSVFCIGCCTYTIVSLMIGGQFDWFVKWRYRGYQHCSWIPQHMALLQDQGKSRVSRFMTKHAYAISRLVRGTAPVPPVLIEPPCLSTPLATPVLYHPPHTGSQGSQGEQPAVPPPATGLLIAGADEDGNLYNPEYCEVDRVIAYRRRKGTPAEIEAEKAWRIKRRELRERRRKLAAEEKENKDSTSSSSSSPPPSTSAPAAAMDAPTVKSEAKTATGVPPPPSSSSSSSDVSAMATGDDTPIKPEDMVDGVDASPSGVKKEENGSSTSMKAEPSDGKSIKIDERIAPTPSSSVPSKGKKSKWEDDDDTSDDDDNDEGIVDEFLVKWRYVFATCLSYCRIAC
jgi:hypothetical protein